jgi:hypothetical protein
LGIFTPAIEEMNVSGLWYRNPESFVSYRQTHGLPDTSTAEAISVDSISNLDRDLRNANLMVFRLGAGRDAKGSRFALARSEAIDMSDYFLLDSLLFSTTTPKLFIPSVSYQSLFAFTLIPKFTETSLVNLAVFSGLLGHAVGLDQSGTISAPATGQSTYTFSFSPRRDPSPVWEHYKGQVEVDALLTGYRQGIPVAVIVESKANSGPGSLAKHKLLYPYLSLRPTIPEYMPILLVALLKFEWEIGVF